MSSYAVEVLADPDQDWYGNLVRLPSEEQAQGYARHVAATWDSWCRYPLRSWRVVSKTGAATHQWAHRKLTRLGAGGKV